MSKRFDLDQIRQFWTDQALSHGQSSAASWSDRHVIELEIREILARLSHGDRVLDIGCANGYSTVQLAMQKQVRVRGLDYIPEMIAEANRRRAGLPADIAASVEFGVGDITQLDEPSAAYDKVVVVRVIINLGNWEQQARGLREAARVVRQGGLLLVSEATLQGWGQLNEFRAECGLPQIPMPPFNTYLDQEMVVRELSDSMELVEIVNFASSYYVGTRVLKPLVAKLIDGNLNVSNPDMHWNRWFSQVPQAGDYGTQKLFVFKRL